MYDLENCYLFYRDVYEINAWKTSCLSCHKISGRVLIIWCLSYPASDIQRGHASAAIQAVNTEIVCLSLTHPSMILKVVEYA